METVDGQHVHRSPSLPRLFGSSFRLGVTAFGGPAMAVSWTISSIFLALAAFAALWFKIDILWVVLIGAAVWILVL